MTSAPLPENWQDLLAGYVLGNLSPEEDQEFQLLLATHPELVEEVDALQEVVGLFPQALAEPESSTDFYGAGEQSPQNVAGAFPEFGRADERLQAPQPVVSQSWSLGRRVEWSVVGGAIATFALIALSFHTLHLLQQLQQERVTRTQLQQEIQSLRSSLSQQRQDAQQRQTLLATLQHPNLHLYILEGTGAAATASARVLVAPGHPQLMVIGQNLPSLPTSQVYRLWLMPHGTGIPLYCGQFNSTATGEVVAQWRVPAPNCNTNAAQLLITRDAAAQPPQPTGELVLKSRV